MRNCQNQQISFIRLKPENIFGQIPPEINSKNIWFTILIIFYFEVIFPMSKGSWILIAQKAEEYLEDNKIEYNKYKDIALEIINSKT